MPKFSTGRARPICYYFDQDNVVGFLNEGGPSHGVEVYFCGPVIDQHLVEIESVSIQMRASQDHYWTLIPMEIKEVPTKDDRRWLYGSAPEIVIPKAVPQGLPMRKSMDMEFERKICVRFRLVSKTDLPLDDEQWLQISLVPMENYAGQYGCILMPPRRPCIND